MALTRNFEKSPQSAESYRKMSDWSSTFWASTAGLFGEEDEGDAIDPDQQASRHRIVHLFSRIDEQLNANF